MATAAALSVPLSPSAAPVQMVCSATVRRPVMEQGHVSQAQMSRQERPAQMEVSAMALKSVMHYLTVVQKYHPPGFDKCLN